MHIDLKKFLGLLFIIVALANFFLFVLGKIGSGTFWIIIVLCALFAFFVLPKIKL